MNIKVLLTIAFCSILLFLGMAVIAKGTTRTIFYYNGNYGVGSTTPTVFLSVDGDLISDMNRQYTVWHAYGGFQNATTTISIAGADQWTWITNGTNDLWTGTQADGMTLSGDIMTITNTGDYTGSLSITFAGLNGKDFAIRVYNITQARQEAYLSGATTTGEQNFTNVALPLYIEATAGDQLRMEIECRTDGTDPTVLDAAFYMSYLHE